MSFSADSASPASASPANRDDSRACGNHQDGYRIFGRGRFNGAHVLCFECFRRYRDGGVQVLPFLRPTEEHPPISPFREVELTQAQVTHRERMLQHLAAAAPRH